MRIHTLIGLLAVPTLLLAAPAAAGDRPNILFIMSDDHAYQAISAYGSNRNRTPSIDRLAQEGMRFDRAFVTNSICAPSRAVILSGLHSHRNGVLTNAEVFDGAQTTFPKLLQSAGYQTVMLGKWHLKSDPMGFDHWEVLPGQGAYYNPDFLTPEGKVRYEGYTTDIITDKALTWLDEDRDPTKPFLLMVQHKAPHRNWQAPLRHLEKYAGTDLAEPETLFDDWSGRSPASAEQEMTIARHLNEHDLKLSRQGRFTDEQRAAWDAAYEPRNEAFRAAGLEGDELVRWKYQRYAKDYLRCIDAVDEGVGRILDWLDDSGLAENTIVVYTSDQGWYLGEHGWYDKRWMYEESFRTPLLVRWPSTIGAGTVDEHLVQNLDFAPTFLDAAGVEIPMSMQGRSMLSILQAAQGQEPGAVPWRNALYYHYYESNGPHAVKKHDGVRTDRYKLIHFYEDGWWELYDLEKDPDEMQSVHDDPAYAAVRADLVQRLEALRTRYGVR